MKFNLASFDEFEVSTQERKALVKLQGNENFDTACEIYRRYLAWTAWKRESGPPQEDQNVDLLMAQGAHSGFKKFLEIINDSKEPPAPFSNEKQKGKK